jgi:DNA-binding transcriptional regulator YiaG
MLKLCHECPNLNNKERGGNLKIKIELKCIRKYKERKILRKKGMDGTHFRKIRQQLEVILTQF